MNNSDAFAYCLDAELVRSVLPDWPEVLSLLLCLKADGTCRTVIFHAEEGSRALRRAAAALELPTRSFPVAPEVKGWPTRAVRFSEEQDMLTLVAGIPKLVAKAKDYLERYEHEKEAPKAPEAVAEEKEPIHAGPVRRLNLGLAKADIAEKVRRMAAEDLPGLARAQAMDAVNPLYIPRNHLVEAALQAAGKGDMDPFERLLAVLERPFDEQPGAAEFAGPAPEGFGPYTTFCGT